jgi:hypothetical protein
MSATSSPNSRQGRKTLENLSATLQAAREDCERICDALPDARTAARIGQHNHSGSIGVLKRTPELDEVIRAIVAADKRLTRLN